eukprot:15986518-Heterocapsa_arctica.AAC.1
MDGFLPCPGRTLGLRLNLTGGAFISQHMDPVRYAITSPISPLACVAVCLPQLYGSNKQQAPQPTDGTYQSLYGAALWVPRDFDNPVALWNLSK